MSWLEGKLLQVGFGEACLPEARCYCLETYWLLEEGACMIARGDGPVNGVYGSCCK